LRVELGGDARLLHDFEVRLMSVLDLVLYPDARLSQMCEPVAEVNEEIQALVDDMVETMYDAGGVGLAAPQIGKNLRITVMDCSDRDEDKEEASEPDLRVLINPEITHREGKLTWEEGCLSIPGVYDKVKRAAKIRVKALDRDGNPYEFEAEELLAVCVQHEIDHLDGVLFLDHLSRLRRRLAERSYKRTLPGYIKEFAERKKERLEAQEGAEAIRQAPSVLSAKSRQEGE
jgi:peptide deformylase